MKTLKTLLVLVFTTAVVIFFGCEKDNNSTNNNPKVGYKLVKEVHTDYSGNHKETIDYIYDNKNRIVKITYSDNTGTVTLGWDTVLYDTANLISIINNYSSGNPSVVNKSYSYTYTNGLITEVVEQSNNGTPYTKTYTFNYTGKLLTSVTSSGDPYFMNMSFKNITYSGGNIDSVTFDPTGTGLITVGMLAQSYDTYPNVAKYAIPYAASMLDYVCANNYIKVITTNDAILGTDTFPAGSSVLDNSYTYTDGHVATRTSYPSIFESDTTITIYTFVKL